MTPPSSSPRRMKKKSTTEDSLTIRDWGDETFGEAASIIAYAIRAQEELNELIQAIKTDEGNDAIVAEAADVTILLHRLVGTIGVQLSDAVDQKMAINRKRIWKTAKDGVGQHL